MTAATQIRIQGTPNPNALKYILDKDVKAEGKVSFTNYPEAEHVPLAYALLKIKGVTQVHFFENVITVTQNGEENWYELDEKIRVAIDSHLPSHDINFKSAYEQKREQLPPELRKIEEILDDTIRPGLQADGGDLQVVSLKENLLTIRYEGACGTCPSATSGTMQAIESILREQYSPELVVEAI